jgi:hypothetical protein
LFIKILGVWGDQREGNFEALLDLLENFLVILVADKGDRETLGSKTTGTSDTVEVGVGIRGKIVVDGQVDALDIDTTAEDVSSNTDTLVELLELLVALDTAGKLACATVISDRHKHTAPPG